MSIVKSFFTNSAFVLKFYLLFGAVRAFGNSLKELRALKRNDQIFTDPFDNSNLLAGMFVRNSCLPDSDLSLPEL